MSLSLIEQIKQGKLWDFHGGIHPKENKKQSSKSQILPAFVPKTLVLPLKQHIGTHGELCVKVGDKVMKGQALTRANLAFMVPIHAPTSGTVVAIEPRTVAHPSGLSDLCVVLETDGEDTWGEQIKFPDFKAQTTEALIEHIRRLGIAGLGGAAFPTARKLQTGVASTEILIINAAECEPYITADDRLMQDYADDIIEGIHVLQHILKPKLTIIAIEDNKRQAINALYRAATNDDSILIRVIPTKYPSGGSKQLIQILTGREVPHKAHSAAVGVLMQNVGTAFAIKRAVVDGEPLIERVVTVTGNSVRDKGNQFVLLGTLIEDLLAEHNYRPDKKKPRLIMGGSLMGFTLPHTQVPVTKITNCIIAPKRRELPDPDEALPCIRCSECANACPVSLLPQQLHWYATSQDYDKCDDYHLFDCIECGACAYVCPSDIPLVQQYRQAKAEIKQRRADEASAERAKIRFEEKQARMEREKAAREQKFADAAAKRREQMQKNAAKDDDGEDAIAAAIARVKAKQAGGETADAVKSNAQKPAVAAAIARAKAKQAAAAKAGSAEPDNSEMKKLREARKAEARAKKQAQMQEAASEPQAAQDATSQETATDADPKKAAVAAAIARAKARKAAQAQDAQEKAEPAAEPAASESDPKKAAVAAAVARAKARKAAQAQASQQEASQDQTENVETESEKLEAPAQAEMDPKKAAVAAAVARAKARKAAQAQASQQEASQDQTENAETESEKSVEPAQAEMDIDPKKAAVAAAVARAKARKAAQAQASQQETSQDQTENVETESEKSAAPAQSEMDPKKAAVAAAVARAKARKAAQAKQQASSEDKS